MRTEAEITKLIVLKKMDLEELEQRRKKYREYGTVWSQYTAMITALKEQIENLRWVLS
jgi:putative ribosome biogenesis GTPase RsgA